MSVRERKRDETGEQCVSASVSYAGEGRARDRDINWPVRMVMRGTREQQSCMQASESDRSTRFEINQIISNTAAGPRTSAHNGGGKRAKDTGMGAPLTI